LLETLLEAEGWYFLDQFEVCVDFEVLWRHPEDGISGIYLGALGHRIRGKVDA
jgi:hypothetical protein